MSTLQSTASNILVLSGTHDVAIRAPAEIPEGLIFFDDFSSGDKKHKQGGAGWSSAVNQPTISTLNPFSGKYSMMFVGEGKTPKNGGNNEQNFNIGVELNEFYLQYMLYLPDGTEPWGGAAYKRQSANAPSNHKFLRSWANFPSEGDGHAGYSKGESIGFSTWPTGGNQQSAKARCTVDRKECNTDKQKVVNLGTIFTDDMRGKWTKIEFGMRRSEFLNDTNTFARVWKDNVLVNEEAGFCNWVSVTNRPRGIVTHGYLFGAANASYVDDTFTFIDNVAWSAQKIG